jgi:hypothetical protein
MQHIRNRTGFNPRAREGRDCGIVNHGTARGKGGDFANLTDDTRSDFAQSQTLIRIVKEQTAFCTSRT